MIHFLEQTVAQDRSGKNNLLYGLCWFLSVFFLICAAFCASGILGQDASGGLSISGIWIVAMLVCLAMAALAFFGKDYLRLEYDYCFTESVIDVSRVLNNKRRKQLIEFDLGKVTCCGSVRSQAFARASAMPGQQKNNWFFHEDADLYFFAHEIGGRRNLTVLELNEKMVEMIKSDRGLQIGAWHDAEGKN